MAIMSSSTMLEILRGLSLPDPTLAELAVDAARAARDDGKTVADCPFPYPTDEFSTACAVAWLTIFRAERECRQVPPITLQAKLAA
jgi:hypothetical protein